MDWKQILANQSDWSQSNSHSKRLSVDEAEILYNEAPLLNLMDAAHNEEVYSSKKD